jgi:hypothetical protein
MRWAILSTVLKEALLRKRHVHVLGLTAVNGRRCCLDLDLDLGLGLGQLVKLVELGLQELFVGQAGLVLGDQRRRERARQGVLDYLVVLGRAQQNAERWPLVRLLHVAVQRLEIEFQLAEVLGLELANFQFYGDQGIKRPVEEEQIEGEVPAADLQRVLAADVARVATRFM